jgi:hypothetical protein
MLARPVGMRETTTRPGRMFGGGRQATQHSKTAASGRGGRFIRKKTRKSADYIEPLVVEVERVLVFLPLDFFVALLPLVEPEVVP